MDGTGALEAVAEDSGRRAATFGAGFDFFSIPSAVLGCFSAVRLFACSSRSFLSIGLSRFGGSANSLLIVSRDFFVYFSLTTMLGSCSSPSSIGSSCGDLAVNETDRARDTL